MLSFFDNIYIMARGNCVYQGSPEFLVPFMEKSGFSCPVNHNPSDYIMETLQLDIDNIGTLSKSIENGNLCEATDIENLNQKRNKERIMEDDINLIAITKMNFPTSFYMQFIILLKRMLLQKSRNMVKNAS